MKRLILILGLLTSFVYAQSKAGFYVVGGQLITVQDTSSRKYLKAVENAGVVPSVIQNFASNYLVTTEKAIGSYSLISAQYPFIGGTAATHSLNMNNPNGLASGFTLVFVNGATHSATGVRGNGTNQYYRTFFTPSVNAVGQVNNFGIDVYIKDFDSPIAGANVLIGTEGDAGTSIITLVDAPSRVLGIVNAVNSSVNTLSLPSNKSGFISINRNSSTTQSLRYNQTSITSAFNSTSLSNREIYGFCFNNLLGNPSNFSLSEQRLTIIRAGFTDTQSLQQSQIVTSYNGFLSRQ